VACVPILGGAGADGAPAYWRTEPHAEHWLLAEWPRGAEEPTKYWLLNLSASTLLKTLLELAKHRWIVELDYLEQKRELGLGHFGGRASSAFQHHATLCIAAYGLQAVDMSRFPPRPKAGGSSSACPAAGQLPATGRRRAKAAGLPRTRSRACGRRRRGPFLATFPATLFAVPGTYDPVT